MKSRLVQIFTGVSVATLVGVAGIASAATGGPSVTLSSTVSGSTNLSQIPISVTFSEPVSNFSSGNVTATNAGVSEFMGSGASYTFNLDPSSQGTTTVSIAADSATSASSSIGNLASNMLSFFYGTQSSSSTTAPSTSTTSTTTEASAPAISNIAVADTDATDATISWTTDTPATSQVFYGTNTYYGANTTEDTTLTTTHSQMLYGLTTGTPYHFYVQSANSGGTATSSDMTFTPGSGTGLNGGSSTTTSSTSTSSAASSTPLAFTGADAVKSSAIADGSFADGWQWVLHFSVPSAENFLSMKFADFTNGSGGTIPAASNIQFYSPQSTNASTSSSVLTETDNDYDGGWLHLASSTSPNQDVDVYVNVAVPSGTPTGTYSTTFGAFSNTAASTSTTQ